MKSIAMALVLLIWILFRAPAWLRHRRRNRLLSTLFPDAWLRLVETLPLYQALSKADQTELLQKMSVFLSEKSFVPCNDAVIDDLLRMMIASGACFLLLHRHTDMYPAVDEILIYPSTFKNCHREVMEGGFVKEEVTALLGEAAKWGTVIFAADQVRKDAYNIKDGRNVVLHEFAHQLDGESGEFNGAPPLALKAERASWSLDFTKGFRALQHHEGGSAIDAYGATNPAEFFAVATECFFERSSAMKEQYPAIYEDLKRYYRQDPSLAIDSRTHEIQNK
jgi:Mlc titration factor MtfA (ptsG expression regulator)